MSTTETAKADTTNWWSILGNLFAGIGAAAVLLGILDEFGVLIPLGTVVVSCFVAGFVSGVIRRSRSRRTSRQH